MKKIFTYSIAILSIAFLLTSCVKEKVVYDNSPNWFSQERGDVVYSSNSCGIYVVETNYGYTIIQNLDGLRTYEGDVMYGNFGSNGTRDFYNYTADIVTRGSVSDYDLTYNEAQHAIDYYCPYGRSSGAKIKQSATSQNKVARSASSVNP